MKYRDLSFIAIILFVVGGTQLLARVNKPPEMPRDFPHSVVSRNVREQCLRCHERQSGQSVTAIFDAPHRQPKQWRASKLDCLLCHRSPPDGVNQAERD